MPSRNATAAVKASAPGAKTKAPRAKAGAKRQGKGAKTAFPYKAEGAALKKQRKALGISRAELGAKLGKSGAAVGWWESGRGQPKPEDRRVIESIFNGGFSATPSRMEVGMPDIDRAIRIVDLVLAEARGRALPPDQKARLYVKVSSLLSGGS
jgi:transcriptional regulator with XRE-family HTH domain